jgi:hypothetical protein
MNKNLALTDAPRENLNRKLADGLNLCRKR